MFINLIISIILMEGVDKYNFTAHECICFLDLQKEVRKNKDFTIQRYASSMNMNPFNPLFRKIMKILFDEGVAKTINIGNPKKIRINPNNLRDFIDEQGVVNKFYDYFHEEHLCSWRPGI